MHWKIFLGVFISSKQTGQSNDIELAILDVELTYPDPMTVTLSRDANKMDAGNALWGSVVGPMGAVGRHISNVTQECRKKPAYCLQ